MSIIAADSVWTQPVFVGIDTHKATHHAAVIDADGHTLDNAQFVAGPAGDHTLLGWLAHWQAAAVGVEQTGTYGAGLTRALQRAGYPVIEVNTPDIAVRAHAGKSDRLDAVMAAEAVRTGRADVAPKDRTAIIESIRFMLITRDSAVRARAKALTQIQALVISAPDQVRGQFPTPAPTARQICASARRWRPDRTRLHQPVHAAKLALQQLAHRIADLDTEIADYDAALKSLTARAAPRLLERPQIGPIAAAQLLVTVGQAHDRIATDAQFARLCGIAPIPASSGKTNRMRLHRGGNRQANKVIHLVAIGRLKHHQPAITYMNRRTTQGLSKSDIIRAMKRLIARELFGALKADLRKLDQL